MVDVGIANCDSFDSETADVKVCEGSDGERRILSRISLAAAPDWFSLWTGVVVVVVAAAAAAAAAAVVVVVVVVVVVWRRRPLNADVRRRRRRHRARFQVAARVGHGRHLEHLEHPEHLEHHLAGGSPFEWKGDRPVERPVESASRASLASRASRASSCRRFAFRVEGRPARRAARRVDIPSISSIPSVPSIAGVGRALFMVSGAFGRRPSFSLYRVFFSSLPSFQGPRLVVEVVVVVAVFDPTLPGFLPSFFLYLAIHC